MAFAGGLDAFVTKLDGMGSALVYSTFLGGGGNDFGARIAVDPAGAAYITGDTSSTNFPTTADAFQTAFSGGVNDGFVTKLNGVGSAVVYSTLLGGNGFDAGRGIAVDAAGSAYVTGPTNSSNFPTTAGAFRTTAGGGTFEPFVAKISMPPAELTANLIAATVSVNFQQGTDLLRSALSHIDAGNLSAACGQLNAFINQVQAQSEKHLSIVKADELIASANQIRAGLGCP